MYFVADPACDPFEYVQLYRGDGTAAPMSGRMSISPHDRSVQVSMKGMPSMSQRLALEWCKADRTCIKVKFGSFDLYFLSPTKAGTLKTDDGDSFSIKDLGPADGGEQYAIVDFRQNGAEQRVVYSESRGIIQWEGFAHGQTSWRDPHRLAGKYGLFAPACRSGAE